MILLGRTVALLGLSKYEAVRSEWSKRGHPVSFSNDTQRLFLPYDYFAHRCLYDFSNNGRKGNAGFVEFINQLLCL